MIPKEFLGAFKAGHLPSCRPYVDEELSWKLLKKVLDEGCSESRLILEYLTKFNNEYYKDFVSKHDPEPFYSDKLVRKALRHEKYARKMDVLSRFDTIYFQPGKEKKFKF